MAEYKIPFNRPSMQGSEQSYMLQALANEHISGDGSFTHKCHAFLEQELGVKKVFLGTDVAQIESILK